MSCCNKCVWEYKISPLEWWSDLSKMMLEACRTVGYQQGCDPLELPVFILGSSNSQQEWQATCSAALNILKDLHHRPQCLHRELPWLLLHFMCKVLHRGAMPSQASSSGCCLHQEMECAQPLWATRHCCN